MSGAAFLDAAERTAAPFVRTAFFAAAVRALLPRRADALFACFDSAKREAVLRAPA